MSSINTGSINVNYPIPGENNPSQGFRDNFAGIKNNLDTAANEITDLQSKAIVKSPLNGINIDNNMNNTLITNALIQGFRNTTYNLGNNLSGNLMINATNGDVQYGTITNNVTLGFSGWPPVGTYGQLLLSLSIDPADLSKTITFPNQVDNSALTLENITGRTVSYPFGITTLQYSISTRDCGATLTVQCLNRPRQSVQITSVVPGSAIGRQGDRPGTIAADANYLYVCTGFFNGVTAIWKRVTLSAW